VKAAAAILALAFASPAAAQDVQEEQQPRVDCTAPDGIDEIGFCAGTALDVAEADMELAYRLALTRAEVLDGDWELRGGAPGGLILRDTIETSQAAWETHSEAHCAAFSLSEAEEGQIGIALALCLERQARLRESELRLFGEMN